MIIDIEKNQDIWKQVEITDEKYLKEVSIGRKFKAIDAHYQLLQATKIFGAYGSDWGVKNESFNNFKVGQKLMGDVQADLLMCQYSAILFYSIGDIKGEIPIHSSIKISYITSTGKHTLDDDFAKKLATDAMTKGLSKLGFNSDVFMGAFDGNKYDYEGIDNTGIKGVEATKEQLDELLSYKPKASDPQKQWIDKVMMNGLTQQTAITAITKIKGMVNGN